ncbi:proline--tRNA ligase [Parvimonas parva]|uniref:proline--tRNA ligase n=1 Tax=Parvimonas parva TaxID=2769485 RepID=UPI0038B285BB
MKMKRYYMPTLREDPQEAEIISHKLLLRAGMIRKSAAGIYSYLPLGYRAIKKVENIVREEMDRMGGYEILMSALQPKEIWEESGRWQTFGPEMFKVSDRNEREFCLGPTAEEYFTTLISGEIKSYKQLPLNIYQIQTKYRDEKRPRFGINRAREFSMKDAYTFDVSPEMMMESYKEMWKAYEKVFNRLGLNYKIVAGDAGAMGGNSSHEFIALSDVGEGVICYCDESGYSATDEKAKVVYKVDESGEEKELELVYTPDCKTIEEVSDFLKQETQKCVKAVDLIVAGEPVIVFIPGDRELNLTKLCGYLGVPEHEVEMMDDEMISKIGTFAGYTGPVDLKVRKILDKRVTLMKNVVVGGNKESHHYINCNFGRDFDGEIVEDLLMVKEGDVCPESGYPLKFARGIEVGNIFQLGTKYSKALNATFLDENGVSQYFWMGSHGIGITRSITAIIEQNNDEKGIIWPIQVAPFHAIVTVVNINDEEQMKLGEKIHDELESQGVEVMLDDRKERIGVKFNDRDLIGIPLRITVGKKAGENIIEFSTRKEMENFEMSSEEAINRVVEEVRKIK